MEFGPGPATNPGNENMPSAPPMPDKRTEPEEQHSEVSELPEPPAWLRKAKEWLFGGNLVAKAGLLIHFFGVSFLLKYAAAWVTVPIELRLAGIVLADNGLLLWGWRIRQTRASISLPVQGAALGILMLGHLRRFPPLRPHSGRSGLRSAVLPDLLHLSAGCPAGFAT